MRIDIRRTTFIRIGVYEQRLRTHWGRLALTLFATLLVSAALCVCDRRSECRAAIDIQTGFSGAPGPTGFPGDPGGPGGPGGLPFPDPVVANASGNPDLVNDAQATGGNGGDGGTGGDGDANLNPNASAGSGGRAPTARRPTRRRSPIRSLAALHSQMRSPSAALADGADSAAFRPAVGLMGSQGEGGLGGNATSLADTTMFLAGGTLTLLASPPAALAASEAAAWPAAMPCPRRSAMEPRMFLSSARSPPAASAETRAVRPAMAATRRPRPTAQLRRRQFCQQPGCGVRHRRRGRLRRARRRKRRIGNDHHARHREVLAALARCSPARPAARAAPARAAAPGGAGANSMLTDAVSGSANDELHLFQYAIAGNGGDSNGGLVGTAGNANSNLTAMKPFGDEFFGTSDARGGHGGDGSGVSNGGDGGTANGSLNLTGPNLVNGLLTVMGGNGGNALGTGNGGNGADVSLLHLTNGSTPMDLKLNQWAFGGDGGNAFLGLAGRAATR